MQYAVNALEYRFGYLYTGMRADLLAQISLDEQADHKQVADLQLGCLANLLCRLRTLFS